MNTRFRSSFSAVLALGASASVLALIASATLSGRVFAQTDQSYFVGAIYKPTAASLIGAAPAETVVAASGAAQTVSFGTYGSAAYDITLSANCTFTFTAPTTLPSGYRQSMFLRIRNTAGAFTMTWPGTMKWNNGTTPTFVTTAGTIYEIEVITTDAGTTYVAK